MSKAADRSRRVSAVTLPFSILSKTSFSTFKRADMLIANYWTSNVIPCGKVGEMRQLSPISLI